MDAEKFIDRVEIMLYYTCGCDGEEATIILEKCLERAKKKAVEQKKHKKKINSIEFWADYIRTHSDEEWSRQQNVLINSQMKNAEASVGKEKG